MLFILGKCLISQDLVCFLTVDTTYSPTWVHLYLHSFIQSLQNLAEDLVEEQRA